eukprot:TRINITY_DN2367_c0_g1_i1.p1 TRINITY_DN2367_c0_g1~~TRINITY_DN2367_c0_g1_i1.p1  ORF type:complete len:1263 (+),score=411.59 TRINITY_DN2367_c0_g1_i1:79-3867(+)
MANVSSAIAKSNLKWQDMGPRVWFLAASPSALEYSDTVDPCAALSLIRKKKDVVVLPSSNDAHEFADFCREMLDLREEQFAYTDDTNSFMLESNNANAAQVIETVLKGSMNKAGDSLMLYPRKLTNAIKKWLPKLQSQGLLIFGDNTPGLKHTSAAILHRHAKDLEQPSLLEEIAPHIQVRPGCICSDVNDLLRGYAKLTAGIEHDGVTPLARIRPLRSATGAHIVIHTEQELRVYDFPLGDVVLESNTYKYTDSEVAKAVRVLIHFVAGQQLAPLTVTRSSNGALVALRNCQLKQSTVDTMSSWVSELLAKTRINASGAGTFEFSVSEDEPTLINVTSGFTTEHFPALFARQYVGNSRIMAWQFTPPDGLDIWTFWYRLYDNGLTYRPGKKRSTTGVFPMNFQKGSRSLFVAVAPSDEEVDKLYQQVDALLRDPQVEEPLQRVDFDDSVRRIWCGSARPEYRRVTQRYNLPNRCVSMVRKDKDFIILPDHKLTREYWLLVKEINQLSDDQVLWTSDEHLVMDDDVNDEIVARIKQLVTLNPKDKFTLVPYCVTANFERWSAQLSEVGVTVFGESFNWVEKYGHKGILHRHVDDLDTPCIIEKVAPNVRVAKGYTCDTAEQLVKAWELIQAEKVVIKPVFGAAGEGILFVSDVEELRRYDFPMGQVILEEFLMLDRTEDGIVLSPAVHYLGASIFGNGLVDQIMVGTGYAGWRRSEASKSFQATCSRAINKIVKAIGPKGPGGFDFLGVEGVPFLTDVNTGRFNGAHYPKLFMTLYAPNSTFYCFKYKPPVSLTASQFWFRLQSADIAFQPGESESGVFPLVYLRGLSGLYICVANSDKEALALADAAKQCLAERVAASRALTPPTEPASKVEMILIKNCKAIYTPEPSHYSGVLLAGTKIVGLLGDADTESMTTMVTMAGGQVIDAEGLIMTPGFVDPHIHVTGGGGENGPSSRTPAVQLSSLVRAGCTTMVGVTGTDSVSRSMENLLTKVRAINEEGLTCYMWTGAYVLPTPTITGSVMRDVCLIEQCIGVGEIAVADHRGSQPTVHDLEKLASECRVGGMLGGKAGVVHVHMGNGKMRLDGLREAVTRSALPISVFYPTHMSRNKDLVKDGAEWIRDGGYVDLTARSSNTVKALTKYFASGVNLERVTVSSDAGGSSPSYDAEGNLLRYKCIESDSMLWLLKKLHMDLQWPLHRALPLFSSNAAEILKFNHKGHVKLGYDGDILLLNGDLDIQYVFAKGKMMKGPGYMARGMFEEPDDV